MSRCTDSMRWAPAVASAPVYENGHRVAIVDIISISRHLARSLQSLEFGPPVTHTYNPLIYARAMHESYLRMCGSAENRVMLLGMNPGPWGMVQTGVPFGEVSAVRDWMGIDQPIGKPDSEHAKRPVLGLKCSRREVSGARLWGWARERFATPARFFDRFFVANYCPLAFMEESGRNHTPDKLPSTERDPLLSACDRALRQTVIASAPSWVIGVGRFAETRARIALREIDVNIGRILHPSPANPAANRGWADQAGEQLANLGIAMD